MLYVPIIKWKRGERIAVRNLSSAVKDQVIPLFSIMANTEPDTFSNDVQRNWGTERPFYFDFHHNIISEVYITDFLESFINENQEIQPIPVVSPNRGEEYLQLINESPTFNHGIALRINLQELNLFQNAIESMLNILEANGFDCDLIIDLGQMSYPVEVVNSFVPVVRSLITGVQRISFRRIIIAGSSFPEGLSVSQNTTTPIPRKEWILWNHLSQDNSNVIFGDYGTDDPEDPHFDFLPIMIPTIRYTYRDDWYIIRGNRNPRNPRDFTQFHDLANNLIHSEYYCGAEFSWGDEQINEVANTLCTQNNCNHGNLERWVQINTNHHITYAVHQLSNSLDS